jgi:hypothetical protein
MARRPRSPSLVVAALALWAALGGRAQAADTPAPDAGTLPTDSPAKAETQAAAAQKAAQDLEAQVIELRRSLEAFERQRAAFEDIRGRLDQLDLRVAEDERRDAALGMPGPSGRSAVRFTDDGFFIRSPDNRFLLRPRVRLQALYTGEIASAGPADMLNGVASNPDVSSFSLAHAEVILEGHAVTPAFEYRFEFDAALAQPLLDAFVQWRATRTIGIRAGQFKLPYGLQNLYWTGDLEFVDVAAPTAAFSPGWDRGVMVIGRPLAGRIQYQVGVLNGAGANLPNDNVDLAYAVRIVAAPFGPLPPTEGDIEGHARPLVEGGVSGFYNLVPTDILLRNPTNPTNPMVTSDLDGDGRVDNVAIWQGNVQLRAIWRGASLQAEWFGRIEDFGAAGSLDRSPLTGQGYKTSLWGVYAQAAYFVIPHRLQVGGRVSGTDLPLYGATAVEHQRQGSHVDEQSAVVSAYFSGSRAKLQVDYSHLASDGTSAPTVHRVRAAVQLAF